MKKLSAVIMSIILITGLGACGDDGGSSGDAVVLKLGHTYAESHSIHQAALLFGEALEELSGGTMKADVYGNSILGADDEMTQQVRMGTLDMHVSAPFYFQSEYPVAMIDELPFLYEDTAHYYAAWDGELGGVAQDQVFSPAGVKALNYWGCGFRYLTNNARPIEKPEDCKGLKIRVAPSVLRTAMIEQLNASPISMTFSEVFTALQQGTVDGQENPLSTMETGKIYEVQKYLSLSEHLFTGAPIIINMEKWDGFTEEQQGWIVKAMEDATEYQRDEMDKVQAELLDFFEGVMTVTAVDKDAFVEAVQPVYELYLKQCGTSQWLDLVRAAR